MVIAKRAVRQFLARPLKDSLKAKRFTVDALDRKIANLWPRPVFKTPPRVCQKVGFLLGVKYLSYMFLYDMGLGKSLLSLYLMRHWIKAGKAKRFLVLVPNTTNIDGWLDEIKIHMPKLRAMGLDGSREVRAEVFDSDAQIVVATYAGILSFVSVKVDSKKKKGKKKMVLDKKLFKQYCKQFDGVIYDEISTARNHTSLVWRMCNWLAKQCPFRYGLTGTPFGRKPEDLWAQFYLVDRGATLGETLGIFRAAFFKAEKSFWSYGNKYEFDKTKRRLLARVLRNRSIRYSESECDDLPKNVNITRRISLPDETKKYYLKVLHELQAAKGNYREVENAFMRMRQMCSGFASIKGKDATKVDIRFGQNPKLDAIIQAIHETPPNRKVVVFHDFTESGRIITQRLAKEKIKHLWLYGKAKGKSSIVSRFKEGKHKVLVSSTAGAYGGNWQIANYTMFYEMPPSPILFKQMCKRVHRQGQKRKTFTMRFVTRNSVEEKIVKFIEEGKDLFKALIEGKKVFL